MLTKVNKADMAGMMVAIKKYLRLHHVVIRVPLAYVIRKMVTVQIYDDYHKSATPDDKMIARMLHLLPDKNRLYHVQSRSIQQSTR